MSQHTALSLSNPGLNKRPQKQFTSYEYNKPPETFQTKSVNLLRLQLHFKSKEHFKTYALIPSPKRQGAVTSVSIAGPWALKVSTHVGEVVVCTLYKNTTWYFVRD